MTARTISTDDAKRNYLLAALPRADLNELLPELAEVDLQLGHALYESGARQNFLYFPTTAVISLLYVTENGSSTEIALAGREGAVGVALFMGGESTPNRAVVQSAGKSLQVRANVVQEQFRRGGAVQRVLLRYTQALFSQMSQTAVCNRHHSLDQQLCRWLLLSLDRIDSSELRMTQQLIADMLGVRREGVTAAASKLQKSGAIKYSRGKITVLDRQALERYVCECYAVVNQEYDRLLHDVGQAHRIEAPDRRLS
ncbi:MAG TPA: Crp/Fnr family transcriptional regulator [Burkholderiaceae bacterium]|nr:Crp/Fnr family transcriptional regulator [Burkholderiaceae bacterium]